MPIRNRKVVNSEEQDRPVNRASEGIETGNPDSAEEVRGTMLPDPEQAGDDYDDGNLRGDEDDPDGVER